MYLSSLLRFQDKNDVKLKEIILIFLMNDLYINKMYGYFTKIYRPRFSEAEHMHG